MSLDIRPIAIYLPQFHPIPENDEWWGRGFTEWTNVVKAKPLFQGHYQPHLPGELGFYDLRLPEVREQQAALAKQYGIYGFCYYHYWFNGRRVLERPFEEVFKSGKPDFPFMLCWANENWTRAWDGLDKQVLLKQNYSHEDDVQHIKTLIPYFKDSRYIKIDGKPVFAIYRSTLFPDLKRTINIWRDEARKEGLELYLCHFESFGAEGREYLAAGFDAAIEFQPQTYQCRPPAKKPTSLREGITVEALVNSISYRTKKVVADPDKKLKIDEYKEIMQYASQEREVIKGYKRYPCVMPGWDNTARRKNGYIVNGSTPERFGKWTAGSLKNFVPPSQDENLFFINAWNEWAEGNHLEPDQKWGRRYLEAFRNALQNIHH